MKTIFCRITTQDILVTEFIDFLLKKKDLYLKAIISEEGGSEDTSRHLHGFIEVNSDDKLKNIYQNFRNYLKESYPKLFGNKSLALTKTQEGTESRMAAYTMKEGNYKYYGYSEKEIERFKKLSFKKQKHTDFQIEKQKLEDSFLLDDFTLRQFVTKYLDLIAKYRSGITDGQIYSYINRMLRIKSPEFREVMVNRICESYEIGIHGARSLYDPNL